MMARIVFAARYAVLGLVCVFCMPVVSFSQSDETLTIVTYYPSPSGVYRSLRLIPSEQPASAVSAGLMYYNDTENLIKFHDGARWMNITPQYWTERGASGKIYTSNLGNSKVGIMMDNPTRELDVSGDVRISSVSGNNKVVCVKSNGNLGTCSSAVSGTGTCTCG